ncbi:hypothetical protein BDM02DRAFT_3192855 [Thelephora ganbajun]|uniref:Uncharacterized protein n=1 Tax=Thelephora ganbajun TaxID=370292 RepID=A0ACB6YZL2_THEGA|nr:hypothetical protein BDM02DRAFT_3192855 [Thelephora ganbajun]
MAPPPEQLAYLFTKTAPQANKIYQNFRQYNAALAFTLLRVEVDNDALFKHAIKPKVHLFNPFAIPGEDNVICKEHEEYVEKGKVVKIPHMAFVTYDEIRSLYIEGLAFVWMEDLTTEMICASVDKKIDTFVEGNLEHVVEMVSAL